MDCVACGGITWEVVQVYNEPDKYEEESGLFAVHREWLRCMDCGHFQKYADYPNFMLDDVYTESYRSKDFRGEEIGNQFYNIAGRDSENVQRCEWINQEIEEPGKLLDIGSGLGLFPWRMRRTGWKPFATEVNYDSLNFFKEILHMSCSYGEPKKDCYGEFDLVSFIHVLEHIENPVEFLEDYKKYIKPDGRFFIEVPNSLEFLYLEKDHDEFNSCHLHFFDIFSLYTVVRKAGLSPHTVSVIRYDGRDLTRIYMLGGLNEA